ncbi:methionyl-tRNA formyltransferase [Mycoplasmoides pirum]|uniref:methionyl-tRNA formyltransferase n=1 Tax=Mycoplasmoides pirum TaxID=2122 RepID=UPI000482C3C0|nr:methionyl-tRNA formyltransferase [Mycoplasmoides pirum]
MITKIIFFGSTTLSSNCLLEILNNKNFEVLAIVCQPDNPKAKKNNLFSEVKNIALKNNIICLQPEKIIDMCQFLNKLKPDIGVCVAYGQFLPKQIRDLFVHGIINVHPSLLPKYRGGAPIQHAIWNNDNKTGISIIKLIKEMDAGPCCFQNVFDIDKNWTAGDLMNEVIKQAPKILVDCLNKIISNQITWIDQNDSKKSYAPVLTKEQEKINWNSSGKLIIQHIKAFSPKPGTYSYYKNNKIFKFFNAFEGQHKFDSKPGTINLIEKKYICIQSNDPNSCVHVFEFLIPGKKQTNIVNYNGKFPFNIGDNFF